MNWLAPLLLLAAAPAGNPLQLAPAHDWVLPLFSPEGYRTFVLRGDVATITEDGDRIDVQDLNITRFSGDAANEITTSVLSPQATYFPKRSFAQGPAGVRILRLREGAELSGEDWTYDFVREKISLRRNVHIILPIALNDFLK